MRFTLYVSGGEKWWHHCSRPESNPWFTFHCGIGCRISRFLSSIKINIECSSVTCSALASTHMLSISKGSYKVRKDRGKSGSCLRMHILENVSISLDTVSLRPLRLRFATYMRDVDMGPLEDERKAIG